MKNKLLFTFACVMALMAGFVSCASNDENYSLDQVEPSINTTRSVSEMTKEEVEARIDELEKKYSVSIMIKDTSRMTESLFEKMELEMMTKQLEQQNNKDKNI